MDHHTFKKRPWPATESAARCFTLLLLLGLMVIYILEHVAYFAYENRGFDNIGPNTIARRLQCVDDEFAHFDGRGVNDRSEGFYETATPLTGAGGRTCAIVEMRGAYLEYQLLNGPMRRLFTPAQIDILKTEIEEHLKLVRRPLFEERKRLIDATAELYWMGANNRSSVNLRMPAPFPLTLYRRETGANQGSASRLTTLPDEVYIMTDLDDLRKWLIDLEELRLEWAAKAEDADRRESRGAIVEGRLPIYASLTRRLESLENHETTVDDTVSAIVFKSGFDLNFQWLHLHDFLWPFELIFWSLFGVLSRTLVALNLTRKAERQAYWEGRELAAARSDSGAEDETVVYDRKRFLLVFTNLLLAPLVAVIVAGVVITGITDFELNLANAPVFLLFAFLSGFASDRFIGVIRGFVRSVIPKLKINDDKVAEIYGPAAKRRAARLIDAGDLIRNVANDTGELTKIIADETQARIALSLSAAKMEKTSP